MSFMDYESLKLYHSAIAANQHKMGFLIDPLPLESDITPEERVFYFRWYEGTMGMPRNPNLTTVAEDEAFNDKIRSHRTYIETPAPPRSDRRRREPDWWLFPKYPVGIQKYPQNKLIVLPNFRRMTWAMRCVIEHLIDKNNSKKIRHNYWEDDNGGTIILTPLVNRVGMSDNEVQRSMFENCARDTAIYEFDIIYFSKREHSRTTVFMWLSKTHNSRYHPITKDMNFWAVSNPISLGSEYGYFKEWNNVHFVAEYLEQKCYNQLSAHVDVSPNTIPASYDLSEMLLKSYNYHRVGAPCFYPIAQALFDRAMDGFCFMEEELKDAKAA